MARSWAEVMLAVYTPNFIGDVLGEYAQGDRDRDKGQVSSARFLPYRTLFSRW